MLNSFIIAAAMLLNGTITSTTQNFVESSNVASAAVWQSAEKMTRATEVTLIEDYAAPYWNLTVAEAWFYYQTLHLIKITEIEADVHYLIEFDGILDVTIDDGNY